MSKTVWIVCGVGAAGVLAIVFWPKVAAAAGLPSSVPGDDGLLALGSTVRRKKKVGAAHVAKPTPPFEGPDVDPNTGRTLSTSTTESDSVLIREVQALAEIGGIGR